MSKDRWWVGKMAASGEFVHEKRPRGGWKPFRGRMCACVTTATWQLSENVNKSVVRSSGERIQLCTFIVKFVIQLLEFSRIQDGVTIDDESCAEVGWENPWAQWKIGLCEVNSRWRSLWGYRVVSKQNKRKALGGKTTSHNYSTLILECTSINLPPRSDEIRNYFGEIFTAGTDLWPCVAIFPHKRLILACRAEGCNPPDCASTAFRNSPRQCKRRYQVFVSND